METGRRKFLSNTVLSGAGFMIGSDLLARSSMTDERGFPPSGAQSKSMMEEILRYRKIDTHVHVYFDERTPKIQLEQAERFGIDKLMISCYLRPHTKGSPEEFRKSNDLTIKLMKEHPDRFLGMMVFNPAYEKETMYEIERCLDAGMVGAGELYNQTKINDPGYFPVIERFIELDMVVMMHSAVGYSRVVLNPNEPKNISLPEDFIDIATRYPEAIIQYAHFPGGIDWIYAAKALSDYPNIYVDLSGSNNDASIIDFALRYIGEDRLFFGTDNAFYTSVGRMMSARLTDSQRKKIFFENYNKILRRSGNEID